MAPKASKPRATPESPKKLNRAEAKAAADRKVLQRVIDRFDVEERERRDKLVGTKRHLVSARGAAHLRLRRESAQIARRMATLGFAANLQTAKARAQLPPWMGGNPLAADPVIAKAVGVRTSVLQASYKHDAGKLVTQVTGITPESAPRIPEKVNAYQVKFGKYIIRETSREMSPYAKSRAVGVLRRAVAKLPASTLDGPLPAVELALFSLTVADIYHQGGAARRAAQMSVFKSAMEGNNAELETATKMATAHLLAHDVLRRRQNCASLVSAYRRTPIAHMKVAIVDRCRPMGTAFRAQRSAA